MNMGFFEWLFLLFIALKLTEQIDWSWWWVCSPAWIVGLVYFVDAFLRSYRQARRQK